MASRYNAQSTSTELVNDLAAQIKGKVILVTGVSPGGLGAAFAEAVAKAHPAELILAGRNPARLRETANTVTTANPNVKVRDLTLDLGSLAKVREAAAEVNSWDLEHIDVLVNNAGIMASPRFVRSPEGFESQLATNYLGPYLFTNLIIGKVLAAKKPRVVIVSSDGHRLHSFRFHDHNFQDGELYNMWYAYGQSKTANMLNALSLAERLGPRGLVAASLHPGVIGTNLANHMDEEFGGLGRLDKELGNQEGFGGLAWKSLDQGTATHVYAAFHPDVEANNGAYFQDCHVADPWVNTVKPWGTSTVEAEKLWKLSKKLVGQEFDF